MKYKDTENGVIYTEAQLKAEFKTLKADDPDTYNYTFKQYIHNCTDKNGFLTVCD